MNKVILSGRWTKDIELRYTPSGTAVAKSTIAVDDGWGDKKQTYFFDVTIWGKTAEATANYSGKGKKILIEGRLVQEHWEKDGQKRSAVKVTAEQVEFIETRTSQSKPDPFEDDGGTVDISDEDLPF